MDFHEDSLHAALKDVLVGFVQAVLKEIIASCTWIHPGQDPSRPWAHLLWESL